MTMSFSVNTNLASMAALQVLNATEQQLSQTQNVISTGQNVSSAADNPAIYAISNTMNSNIAGLTAVQNDLSFGQSVLTTASNAASQISSQLASLQQTVTQGLQTGISATTMNNQITSILTNINQFANNATFNGVNVLAKTGTAGVNFTSLNVVDTVQGNTITVGAQVTGASTNIGDQIGVTGLTVSSGALQYSFGSTFAPASGDYLQLTNGSKTWVLQLQKNGATPVAPPAFTANTNTTYTAVNFNSTDSPMTIVGDIVSSLQQQGFGASLDNSGNLTITGNGVTATNSAWNLAATAWSATPGTSTATGVTQTAISGGTAALTIVANAISAMNTISASIGAVQQQVTGMQTFTSSLQNSLTAGVGALTDANMAAESAQLASLQTKQQLGIQSLSMANARPQSMLQLFR